MRIQTEIEIWNNDPEEIKKILNEPPILYVKEDKIYAMTFGLPYYDNDAAEALSTISPEEIEKIKKISRIKSLKKELELLESEII